MPCSIGSGCVRGIGSSTSAAVSVRRRSRSRRRGVPASRCSGRAAGSCLVRRRVLTFRGDVLPGARAGAREWWSIRLRLFQGRSDNSMILQPAVAAAAHVDMPPRRAIAESWHRAGVRCGVTSQPRGCRRRSDGGDVAAHRRWTSCHGRNDLGRQRPCPSTDSQIAQLPLRAGDGGRVAIVAGDVAAGECQVEGDRPGCLGNVEADATDLHHVVGGDRAAEAPPLFSATP